MVDKSGSVRSTSERAERLQHRRARIMAVEAVLFLGLQVNYFTTAHGDIGEPLRTVDHVRLSAMVVMSIALLVLIATGGGWSAGREVRAMMNDETTRDHRRRAIVAGYWAVMASVLGIYVLAQIEPVKLIEAIHIALSFGIAVPLLRFAQLERRALRNG